MCAGLIRPVQGTFHAITTELEKSIPSIAPCAAPPHFVQVYTLRVGTGKSSAARIWKIFSEVPPWLPGQQTLSLLGRDVIADFEAWPKPGHFRFSTPELG